MGSGSGLSGCFACIKYLMFAFNFIFWLIGCALVGFGIWVLVDDTFKELAADTSFAALQYAGIGIIVVGCVIMIIGFFGCCGAIRESKCLLVSFFVCMFILFAGLIAVGTLCFIRKDEFIELVIEEFEEEIQTYDPQNSNLVNLIQQTLGCCGLEDYKIEYKSYIQAHDAIPASCPQHPTQSFVAADDTPGCKAEAEQFINDYGVILAAVSISTGCVMLIGMVFSMLLCCAIKESYE